MTNSRSTIQIHPSLPNDRDHCSSRPSKGYKVQPSNLPPVHLSTCPCIWVPSNSGAPDTEPKVKGAGASFTSQMPNSEPNSIIFHHFSLQCPDFNILQHFMHRTHWYIGYVLLSLAVDMHRNYNIYYVLFYMWISLNFSQCSSTLKFHYWHLLVQTWIHDEFLSLQRKLSKHHMCKASCISNRDETILQKNWKNMTTFWNSEEINMTNLRDLERLNTWIPPKISARPWPSLACRALIVHLWDMPPGGPEIPRSPGMQRMQRVQQAAQAELNTSQWPNHDHPWDTALATRKAHNSEKAPQVLMSTNCGLVWVQKTQGHTST